MDNLELRSADDGCSIYEIAGSPSQIKRLVITTPETRAICNDPFIVGVDYTHRLQSACTKALKQVGGPEQLGLIEASTTVLHKLRGGLNFGLRDALYAAYGWNRHASAFLSSQRMRREESEDWYISEKTYQKVYLPKDSTIILGDVVVSGTSLQFVLQQLLSIVEDQDRSISALVFFTIGGPRSEVIFEEINMACRNRFPRYKCATIFYIEGRFAVETSEIAPRRKITGTDLLRRGALLAPEFVESQYANPAYPLERCAIYDAGSRAFWLPEFLRDVGEYWSQTLDLARQGATFDEMLSQRFPELDAKRFGSPDLVQIAMRQRDLARCSS